MEGLAADSMAQLSFTTLMIGIASVLALILGVVGTDVNSGVSRFTFDIFELWDGIGLIASGSSDLRIAFSCLEVDEIETLFEMLHKAIQELL